MTVPKHKKGLLSFLPCMSGTHTQLENMTGKRWLQVSDKLGTRSASLCVCALEGYYMNRTCISHTKYRTRRGHQTLSVEEAKQRSSQALMCKAVFSAISTKLDWLLCDVLKSVQVCARPGVSVGRGQRGDGHGDRRGAPASRCPVRRPGDRQQGLSTDYLMAGAAFGLSANRRQALCRTLSRL